MFRSRGKPAVHDGKLGTFLGVFTPTILTILGVIMFLRFGNVVGDAGIVQAIHAVAALDDASGVEMLFTADEEVGSGSSRDLIVERCGIKFGLFQAAQYYYYPGWHEPGTALEGLVNADAYAALPADLQAIVKYACQAANMDMFADFEARNGEALSSLVNDHGVELRAFPDEVLAELKRAAAELIEEQAATDPMSGKVWASLKSYMENARTSTAVGSQYFVNHR